MTCSAIELAFDRGVEIPPHRLRRLKCANRHAIDVTVVIVGLVELHDHVAIFLIVADAPNEAAVVDRLAFERSEVDRATVFHVHRF